MSEFAHSVKGSVLTVYLLCATKLCSDKTRVLCASDVFSTLLILCPTSTVQGRWREHTEYVCTEHATAHNNKTEESAFLYPLVRLQIPSGVYRTKHGQAIRAELIENFFLLDWTCSMCANSSMKAERIA